MCACLSLMPRLMYSSPCYTSSLTCAYSPPPPPSPRPCHGLDSANGPFPYPSRGLANGYYFTWLALFASLYYAANALPGVREAMRTNSGRAEVCACVRACACGHVAVCLCVCVCAP